MGENVSHIEETLHNAKEFVRSLTGPDDEIANAVIAEIDKAMLESLPALARQAEALQRENAEKDARIAKLREALADSLSSFRCTQNADRYPADHWCRRARALLGGSENAGN